MEKIKIKFTPNKLGAINALLSHTLRHDVPDEKDNTKTRAILAYVSILENICERLMKKEVTQPKKEFSISFQYFELHAIEVCLRSYIEKDWAKDHIYLDVLIKDIADDINQKLA